MSQIGRGENNETDERGRGRSTNCKHRDMVRMMRLQKHTYFECNKLFHLFEMVSRVLILRESFTIRKSYRGVTAKSTSVGTC